MYSHPAVELDVDFSDSIVDVIEEGFDVVIRTGVPRSPTDLSHHACLHHKFPTTGKLEL